MSHEWHKGTLTASSWHGLEEVGTMANADEMIAAGENSGAWPVKVALRPIHTLSAPNTLTVPGNAVIAKYANGELSALAAVGNRYRATTPEEWRTLVRAAADAGAKPTGAFSLRDGCRILATFEVDQADGIRTNLVLADSFDGSLKLTGGQTSIRTVCANTLSAAMRNDGKSWAGLRHTASLGEKINALAAAIEETVKAGTALRETYEAARNVRLSRTDVGKVLDALFPTAELEGRALAVMTNKRDEATRAMSLAENNEGPNLATVWNGATWTVDRNLDGTARQARGGADRLDSMLFGSRGKRINAIGQTIGQVLDTVDGSGLVASLLDQPVRSKALN